MTIARNRPGRRWVILIAGAVVLGLGVGLTLNLTAAHYSAEYDRMAGEYVQRMRPQIAARSPFWGVTIRKFSVGRVWFGGFVRSKEALAALHKFIESTPPPDGVGQNWHVEVNPDKAGWFGNGEFD